MSSLLVTVLVMHGQGPWKRRGCTADLNGPADHYYASANLSLIGEDLKRELHTLIRRGPSTLKYSEVWAARPVTNHLVRAVIYRKNFDIFKAIGAVMLLLPFVISDMAVWGILVSFDSL